MYAKEGENLMEVMRSRRDQFAEASHTFYGQIAKYPDVYASNKREYVEIDRIDDDHLRLSIYKRDKESGEKKGAPFFDRTFDCDETKDIRLYLLGGDDKVVVTGEVERKYSSSPLLEEMVLMS